MAAVSPDFSIGAWLGTAIAGIIWGVRLEGRVNAHDQLFEEREKQADERHEITIAWLQRVEAKLDKALEE